MFVTSDIFDFQAISRFQRREWRENLLCGVDIQGRYWPGYQAAARFMLEASQRCGLMPEMMHAGYNRAGESRTRQIKPKNFERLVRGELSGAKDASAVLLTGIRRATGTYYGGIHFGGEAGSIRCRRGPTGPIPVAGPPWRFSANFVFPLNEDPLLVASDLFKLAVDLLDGEYGYHYIRDALCGPELYTHGISSPLDYNPLYMADNIEVGAWGDAVGDGRIWSGPHPLLRDLFQVNLLSEAHMAVAFDGLGRLTDWIPARPGRGRLDSLGEGHWLWTLTDAEMVHVRPMLNAAGLLLSCNPRVYRDLPDGGREVTPSAGAPPG